MLALSVRGHLRAAALPKRHCCCLRAGVAEAMHLLRAGVTSSAWRLRQVQRFLFSVVGRPATRSSGGAVLLPCKRRLRTQAAVDDRFGRAKTVCNQDIANAVVDRVALGCFAMPWHAVGHRGCLLFCCLVYLCHCSVTDFATVRFIRR